MEAMREDLREAYITIEAEQLRRQQLEEDLRRLFLKNMTTMNFEALSLFQNCHNMVETVPTAVHASTNANSSPRPVRRDLSPSSTRSARNRNSHAASRSPTRNLSPPGGVAHSHRRDRASHQNPQQAQQDEFMRQQQLQYEQIEHLISGSNSLQTPSVRTPPVQALRPHYVPPAFSADNHPLVVGRQPQEHPAVDEVFSRTPLSTTRGGSSDALHTNQLNEMYRASISSTNRLAHNTPPPHEHGHHSTGNHSTHDHHYPHPQGFHHGHNSGNSSGNSRHSPPHQPQWSRNSPESVPSIPSLPSVSSSHVPVSASASAPSCERVRGATGSKNGATSATKKAGIKIH